MQGESPKKIRVQSENFHFESETKKTLISLSNSLRKQPLQREELKEGGGGDDPLNLENYRSRSKSRRKSRDKAP